MELALLSGDTSGDIPGASNVGVSASNANWAEEYFTGAAAGPSAGPRLTQVYDPKTGGTVAVSSVSSVGKRKGHVNALVANAAKMEEIMMRDRAKLGKTKKQTNAKYGW